MSLIRDIFKFLCGWILLVSESRTQVIEEGYCPHIKPLQDFHPYKYLGLWYEVERYFSAFELLVKCVSVDYKDDGDGVMGITSKQLSFVSDVAVLTYDSKAIFPDPSIGQMEVLRDVPLTREHIVLGTDYRNFSVVYSCSMRGRLRLTFAWILTREKHPSEQVLQAAYAVFDENGLSREQLMKTDQGNCPPMEVMDKPIDKILTV